MKAKVKTVIDVGMLILHNILDRRWYSGLFKGKYTPIRIFHMTINLLLLVSFLGVAVSSVFLSTTLSNFFHMKTAMLGRRMHMVLTTWSFVLTSAHVGLHGNRRIGMIKKKSKRIRFLRWIFIMSASVYGLHAFISRELIQRMFFLSEYAFFDYNESILHVTVDYVAILCLVFGITYEIGRLLQKKNADIRQQ